MYTLLVAVQEQSSDKQNDQDQIRERGSEIHDLQNNGCGYIVGDLHLNVYAEKTKMWFPKRSDTNQSAQLKKITRGWKFGNWKV